MELFRILQTDFDFTDERGKITQLVHEGFEQVNVLTSKKGVLRGAHFHRLRREAFYVLSGSAEFTLTTSDSAETVLFHTGDFFLIEQGIVHSLYLPEDCVMVQLYDRPVELPDGSKDICREELLEN